MYVVSILKYVCYVLYKYNTILTCFNLNVKTHLYLTFASMLFCVIIMYSGVLYKTLSHSKAFQISWFQVKGLSMEMSQDAWVKQQTQQNSGDRHQTRIKTSPVSGSGNCEVQESAPPQSHTTSFAPIMPQYGIHTAIHGSGSMGRYAPPAHLPIHATSHRRPAPPKPSPSQSPHARNYR